MRGSEKPALRARTPIEKTIQASQLLRELSIAMIWKQETLCRVVRRRQHELHGADVDAIDLGGNRPLKQVHRDDEPVAATGRHQNAFELGQGSGL
jgi:hypothetical protein